MAITDPPTGDQSEGRPDGKVSGRGRPLLPSQAKLRWPVVQALRAMGDASDAELADHVAEAMNMTHEQRTTMIPSGVETKLKNQISWTVLQLKHIGVLHYPKPGRRALTPLGLEVDEERINALRAAYEANKPLSASEERKGMGQADTVTAWLIRAGQGGEHYDYNLEHGLAGLGWRSPDLRSVSGRHEVEGFLRSD